jgi:hypothetical protein
MHVNLIGVYIRVEENMNDSQFIENYISVQIKNRKADYLVIGRDLNARISNFPVLEGLGICGKDCRK